jgi:predicted NAD-dependent protein-ADP-ribosyltransferase YbiA (DUF1768 family)
MNGYLYEHFGDWVACFSGLFRFPFSVEGSEWPTLEASVVREGDPEVDVEEREVEESIAGSISSGSVKAVLFVRYTFRDGKKSAEP